MNHLAPRVRWFAGAGITVITLSLLEADEDEDEDEEDLEDEEDFEDMLVSLRFCMER